MVSIKVIPNWLPTWQLPIKGIFDEREKVTQSVGLMSTYSYWHKVVFTFENAGDIQDWFLRRRTVSKLLVPPR